jgi:uncharacterized membrane protein YdbT with pleckstrin-like domain
VAVFLFQFGNALVFLLLAVGLPWMAWRVVDWANDYYVVTNKRVAHREKVLLISERRDETPLDKIQNMNIARNFWGNHLGFGILVIDTAAAAGAQRVVFDYLDDPEEVQRRIFEQVARLQAGERLETRRAIRDKLDAGIGVSVRPVVPHPCVPVPEDEQTPPSGPNLWQRFANATWRRWLWVEQQEGDQIIWRKHPIRLLAKTWAPGLVGAVLTVVLVLFLAARDRQWAVVFGLVVTLLLVGIWLWWNFENWGNDQYIVTTDRIIDIESLPLGFRSRRTETTFDRIQNVSYDIPHPVATILNYGTVTIFTAGAVGKLDFEFVRNPKTVQAEIFRRLSAYEARQRREQREQRWADMPEWFAEYDSRHRS